MADSLLQRGSRIRFGPYQLDARAGELRKFGIRIRLREQPLQILLLLLEHPGEIVTRAEIRATLWPNQTAGEFDHGINAAVKRLRDALSDSADAPRYIETVARRGYRFLGEVEIASAPPAHTAHPSGTAAEVRPTSDEPVARPSARAQAIPRSRRRRAFVWAAAVMASALVVGVAWISRPVAPPRVTRIVRLTNDPHGNGAPMLTGGVRLFFNLASLPEGSTAGPSQMSLKGGDPVPLALPSPRTSIADLSPDFGLSC